MAVERLHKVMANAGIASRRECEEMIAAGRVSVNGKIVTEMGVKVDPQHDLIRVDDEPIKVRAQPKPVYVMLYKPAGYLSVFNDERGRPGLEALVKMDTRLYPVGRLDADSEGLQLLTNDGELTLRLSHPRYEHAKTYLVLLDRIPGTDSLARFRRGIELEDGRTSPSEWRVLEKPPSVFPPSDPAQAQGVWVQVTLREGRKRQIRRMAAAEKLSVRRLIRIGMGPLKLDRKLRPGQSRPLTGAELRLLQEPATGRSARPPRRFPSERDTASVNRRSSPDRGLEPGRRSEPSDRGGPARPRPPMDRASEPARPRHPSDRAAGAGRRSEPSDRGGSARPRPPVDRASEPARPRHPSDRAAGPSRPRPPADRGSEPRHSAPSRVRGTGYPRPSSDRDSAEGYGRPSSDRDRQPRQRPSTGRTNVTDRQRKPYEPGPRRSERETAETRQSSHDRRDRPEPPASGAGRPERSQSPLRFQRPSGPSSGKRPGGYQRDDRRENPRSKPESGKPSDRYQGSERIKRRKPRPGGPPKSHKP